MSPRRINDSLLSGERTAITCEVSSSPEPPTSAVTEVNPPDLVQQRTSCVNTLASVYENIAREPFFAQVTEPAFPVFASMAPSMGFVPVVVNPIVSSFPFQI